MVGKTLTWWDRLVVVSAVALVLGLLLEFLVGMRVVITWLKGPDAAAWVQAIGTILAVGLTGGLAVWEARQRRLESGRRAAARLRARIALLSQTTALVEAFVRNQTERVGNRRRHWKALAYMLEASQGVGFTEMPNEAAVRQLALYNASALAILESLDHGVNGWYVGRPLELLQERAAAMRISVTMLQAQVEIVERYPEADGSS